MLGLLQRQRLRERLLQRHGVRVRHDNPVLRYRRRGLRCVRLRTRVRRLRVRLRHDVLRKRLLRRQRQLPARQYDCGMRRRRNRLYSLLRWEPMQ